MTKKNNELIKYTQEVKLLINKSKNTRKTKIKMLAKILKIKKDLSKLNFKQQCTEITTILKKRKSSSPIIKELLDNSGLNPMQTCRVFIDVLYDLLYKDTALKRAPIMITHERYYQLIHKNKTSKLTKVEKDELYTTLNIKYCYCIQKLFSRNQFNRLILGIDTFDKGAPYAICMSSIYKNRGIKPPHNASRTCGKKYQWYK